MSNRGEHHEAVEAVAKALALADNDGKASASAIPDSQVWCLYTTEAQAVLAALQAVGWRPPEHRESFCETCGHTAGKHAGTKRGGSSCDVASCRCATLAARPPEQQREGMPCRFPGCPDEATYICLMDKGCACYPNDRVQLLCAQHAHESEPLGSFESRPLSEQADGERETQWRVVQRDEQYWDHGELAIQVSSEQAARSRQKYLDDLRGGRSTARVLRIERRNVGPWVAAPDTVGERRRDELARQADEEKADA
jgi:hypothetical protein